MSHSSTFGSKDVTVAFSSFDEVKWKKDERGRLVPFNNKTMNAKDWLNKFEKQYVANKWKLTNVSQYLEKLSLALGKVSHRWFEVNERKLEEQETVEDIRELFLNEFKTEETLDDKVEKLRNRIMRPNEEVRNYIYDVVEIVSGTYDDQEFIMSSIITGLTKELKELYKKEKVYPESVTELTNELVKLEKILHENKKTSTNAVNLIDRYNIKNRQENSNTRKFTHHGNAPYKQNETGYFNEQNRNNNKPPFRPTHQRNFQSIQCHYCGKHGHTKYVCWNANKYNQEQNESDSQITKQRSNQFNQLENVRKFQENSKNQRNVKVNEKRNNNNQSENKKKNSIFLIGHDGIKYEIDGNIKVVQENYSSDEEQSIKSINKSTNNNNSL